MKKQFIIQGLLYIFLGFVFVYFAIQEVNINGWDVIAYVIIVIATFDFVTGCHFIFRGFRKHLKK